MEFLDEYESRPRLLIQSKQLSQPPDPESIHSSYIHRPTLLVFLPLSITIFCIAFRHIDLEPLKSILLWLSCSLLLGPFAPPSLTAGDIRVGLGPIIEETPKVVVDTDEKVSRKSSKPISNQPREFPVRFDGLSDKLTSVNGYGSSLDLDKKVTDSCASLIEGKFEEREWSSMDEDVLRKLMGKHPVGQPGRWEAIAQGFKGKHTVESVILKAKEMGVKKAGDQDSFGKFLKDRKPVDKRVLDDARDGGIGVIYTNVQEGGTVSGWSAGEDLALLNALKAFPKDVSMRWEKIVASLPDKTKSACMKRVTELKKDFRNSRTSTG